MRDSPNLDLLRAGAVALVVLSHLPWAYVPPWLNTRCLGHVGVAMFFVHTTLVLLMSLERDPRTVAFFVRRFFRLYPLSVTMVLATAAMMLASGTPASSADVVSNLLLVQNLTGASLSLPPPLWTLCFEVQMYVLLPALFWVARSARALLWVSVILAACAVAALATGAAHMMKDGVGPTLLAFVPCFLPGALAFVIGPRGKRSPALLALLAITGAVGIPLLVPLGVPEIPLLWALCLALGLTIPQCQPVENAALRATGKTVATYSYGIYLTHFFAVGLAMPGVGVSPLQCVMLSITLPAFAWIAYHGIEKHGIRLGTRLAGRLQRPAMRVAATP